MSGSELPTLLALRMSHHDGAAGGDWNVHKNGNLNDSVFFLITVYIPKGYTDVKIH